jgi:hypothetical protein
MIGGVVFASLTVDTRSKNDPWQQRPELRPFPAMVAQEQPDVTQRTALDAHYQSYRNEQYKEGKKSRTWYRLLFPNDADYNVKQNPYAHTHRENVYNPANNYYARPGSQHYRHHVNE